MLILILAAQLTVVSAADSTVSSSPPSWSCAYVAARLPQRLAVLGEDALSAEETRAARRQLSLSDAILTRASNLALARSLGATRLVVVSSLEEVGNTTLEAQSFDTERPEAGEVIQMVRPTSELPSAIDLLAQRLNPGASPAAVSRPPSARALATAGVALSQPDVYERARGLTAALKQDPSCLELRLSTVEALMAARDFDAAAQLASTAPGPDGPQALARRLRFQSGTALLESGRYAEARAVFGALRGELPTAAALNNLGVALFRLRDKSASEVLEQASFLSDHRQRDIAFNRSLTLLFEGKPEKALARLDLSLQSGPSDVRTRLLRTWALRLLNREADRDEEWERLMAMAPSFSALGKPDMARRLERIFHFERKPGV